MKIKYYGTAAAEGVPALFCTCENCRRAALLGGRNIRTRSQALIDEKILIDFPPDTYMHTVYGGLRADKIRTCLITHAHGDHLCSMELAMRRKYFAALQTEEPLAMYAPPAAAELIRQIQKKCDMDRDNRLTVTVIEPFEAFEAEGYTITPLAADHDLYSTPVCYLIEKDGSALLYAHDTGYLPESTWEFLADKKMRLGLVSFDCTLCLLDTSGLSGECHGHMSLGADIRVRNRLRELGCIDEKTVCVINHFSHNYEGALYDDLVPSAEAEGFIVSYDGMEAETG